MNKYLVLLFLNLVVQIHMQNCSSLRIEAIYPCTVNYQGDNMTNTCMLSSCTTESPGNKVDQTNATICFVSCCPGYLLPSTLSKDSMLECYNKFNNTPALFYIIGMLMLAFLIAICVILPCCINKGYPLHSLRQKIYDFLVGRRKKGSRKQKSSLKQKSLLPDKSMLEMSKMTLPQKSFIESQPMTITLDIDLIIQQKEDGSSSPENICLLCSKKHVTCKLSCNHFYHWECIAASWQNLNCCPLCEQKEIFPLTYYCYKCFKVGVARSSLVRAGSAFVCSRCK